MTEVIIPESIANAVQAVMTTQGIPLSKVRNRQVIETLENSDFDSVEVSFYLKKYKQQNKKVSKLSKLLDAVNSAIDMLAPDSNERMILSTAVADFNGDDSVEEDEF